MIRWLSFSSDRPSFTAGHVRTGATHASTGPDVAVALSEEPSPEATSDPSGDVITAFLAHNTSCYYGLSVNCRVCGYCRATYKRNCDHKRGVWCACRKQTELPEDDPDVIHEHVLEETY